MVVRKIDDMGRYVIPKEIRDLMAINEGDGLEIFVDDKKLVLMKHTSVCFACSGTKDVQKHNMTFLCIKCRDKLTVDVFARIINEGMQVG